jgi:hypothetical protein
MEAQSARRVAGRHDRGGDAPEEECDPGCDDRNPSRRPEGRVRGAGLRCRPWSHQHLGRWCRLYARAVGRAFGCWGRITLGVEGKLLPELFQAWIPRRRCRRRHRDVGREQPDDDDSRHADAEAAPEPF